MERIPQGPEPRLDSHADFPDTEWSVILSPREGDVLGTAEALDRLCRAYLPPIYAYFRAALRVPPHDAEDLALQFVGSLGQLAHHLADRTESRHGRFRDFLRRCARNFAANERERANAQKRGGTHRILSYEDNADWIDQRGPEGTVWRQAEATFDREWAATMVARARRAVADEYVRGREVAEWDAFAPYLLEPPPAGVHAAIAATLGITEAASRKKLERLRQRFRARLRSEVGRTVLDASEIDAELRHLMDAWLIAGATDEA